MLRIAIFLFLVMSLNTLFAQNEVNQEDEKGLKQGFWQKKLPNGNLVYEGTFKDDRPVGEFKRYHTSGLLKARLFYPETSDTVQAELYDLRGKLMGKGNYLGQQKEGKWEYFQKGEVVAEEMFVHGQKNGLAKTYYPTGELFEETPWKDDQKNGIYRAYFKSGKPYLECRMKDGKRDGTCQVYFENGMLELDAFYTQGLRQNEWRYFNPDGSQSYTLVYQQGMLINPEVLDSIQQIQFGKLEQNRKSLVDPEKFMGDPLQYMMKNNILGR